MSTYPWDLIDSKKKVPTREQLSKRVYALESVVSDLLYKLNMSIESSLGNDDYLNVVKKEKKGSKDEAIKED